MIRDIVREKSRKDPRVQDLVNKAGQKYGQRRGGEGARDNTIDDLVAGRRSS